jgi:hypothetical protein
MVKYLRRKEGRKNALRKSCEKVLHGGNARGKFGW